MADVLVDSTLRGKRWSLCVVEVLEGGVLFCVFHCGGFGDSWGRSDLEKILATTRVSERNTTRLDLLSMSAQLLVAVGKFHLLVSLREIM